jgi:hypothetical protein
MCPFNFRSNGIPRGVRMPFAPKTSLFVLNLLMRESSGEATKAVIGRADSFALPSHVCSPVISDI